MQSNSLACTNSLRGNIGKIWQGCQEKDGDRLKLKTGESLFEAGAVAFAGAVPCLFSPSLSFIHANPPPKRARNNNTHNTGAAFPASSAPRWSLCVYITHHLQALTYKVDLVCN
jgi:hypothetical protein